MFVIHSRDNCKFCTAVKQYLDDNNLDYTVLNLGEDFTREEFVNNFGEGSTFPRVVLEGKTIGGAKETLAFLKENNYV